MTTFLPSLPRSPRASIVNSESIQFMAAIRRFFRRGCQCISVLVSCPIKNVAELMQYATGLAHRIAFAPEGLTHHIYGTSEVPTTDLRGEYRAAVPRNRSRRSASLAARISWKDGFNRRPPGVWTHRGGSLAASRHCAVAVSWLLQAADRSRAVREPGFASMLAAR